MVPVRETAPTLFQYPEGSTHRELTVGDMEVSPRPLSTQQQTSRQQLVKPYGERQRLREIVKSNKRLLSNVIKMERDFLKLKKTLDSTGHKNMDLGMRPEHLSTTVQTSMIRPLHHTTQNRKQAFHTINKENSRLFTKLNAL